MWKCIHFTQSVEFLFFFFGFSIYMLLPPFGVLKWHLSYFSSRLRPSHQLKWIYCHSSNFSPSVRHVSVFFQRCFVLCAKCHYKIWTSLLSFINLEHRHTHTHKIVFFCRGLFLSYTLFPLVRIRDNLIRNGNFNTICFLITRQVISMWFETADVRMWRW